MGLTARVLALDLERTLIDNALSAEPRPGLYEFLAFCHSQFARVVLFTTVEQPEAEEVMKQLSCRGIVPQELLDRLEYVEWSGEYKDLNFIPDSDPEEVLLVDDDPGWVRPDQRNRWIPITAWDGGEDCELRRTQAALERRLAGVDSDDNGCGRKR
jgi:hypothetical protein